MENQVSWYVQFSMKWKTFIRWCFVTFKSQKYWFFMYKIVNNFQYEHETFIIFAFEFILLCILIFSLFFHDPEIFFWDIHRKMSSNQTFFIYVVDVEVREMFCMFKKSLYLQFEYKEAIVQRSLVKILQRTKKWKLKEIIHWISKWVVNIMRQ